MKKTANIVLSAWLTCMVMTLYVRTATAEDVQIGDTKEKALEVLGFPKGQMAVGGGLLLLYDRGTLTIEDGKVTGTTIASQAEYEAEKAEKERQEAARKAAAAAARAKRIVAGTAERKKKESDEEFLASPAAARLAYWRGFKQKYPEVSVDDKITPLAQEVEGAQKAERKKTVTERIAKLEKEEIPATVKASEMQYQFGGQGKRRDARIKLKGLKDELAKLKAELKTL